MRLIVASQNKGKIREIRQLLCPYFDDIVSMAEAGLMDSAVEDGNTFYENALKKAEYVSSRLHCSCIADDSGLCVDALQGAPAIYSARYAGEPASDVNNNQKLLREMLHQHDRRAQFVSVVVLYLVTETGNSRIVSGTGMVQGRILTELSGDNGFGYDPLFYCDELQQSFGQASDAEKNLVSHRSRAIHQVVEKLKAEGIRE